MKKILLQLFMIMHLLQSNVIAKDSLVRRAVQGLYALQYLRKIKKLKKNHQIPKLIIKSIVNNTEHNFFINTYNDENPLSNLQIIGAKREIVIGSRTNEFQQKISKKGQLSGLSEYLTFSITLIPTLKNTSSEFESLPDDYEGDSDFKFLPIEDQVFKPFSQESLGFFNICFFVGLHNNQTGAKTKAIEDMAIGTGINYYASDHHCVSSFYSLNVDKFDKYDELEVIIDIQPWDSNKFHFKNKSDRSEFKPKFVIFCYPADASKMRKNTMSIKIE